MFGESAGAQNVLALYVSPLAQGRFHRAIAQSGGFWHMTVEQATHLSDASPPGTPLSAARTSVAVANRLSGLRPIKRWTIASSSLEISGLIDWVRGGG